MIWAAYEYFWTVYPELWIKELKNFIVLKENNFFFIKRFFNRKIDTFDNAEGSHELKTLGARTWD